MWVLATCFIWGMMWNTYPSLCFTKLTHILHGISTLREYHIEIHGLKTSDTLQSTWEVSSHHSCGTHTWGPLNIKISSYQYRDFHYKDKVVKWPYYFYNRNPHTWKHHLFIEMGSWWPVRGPVSDTLKLYHIIRATNFSVIYAKHDNNFVTGQQNSCYHMYNRMYWAIYPQ